MLTKPENAIVHRSDGTEGKQHRATVLLGDWHTEYTGNWPKRYGGWPDDWAQVRGIDVFLLQEVYETLTSDELSETTLRLLMPGFEDDEISQYSTVWVIDGTPDGHEAAFVELLGWLDCQPSGDDDFFDYWPNTMDMAWQYAADLDAWETKRMDFSEDVGVVTRRKKVRDLVSKVWKGAQADIRHEWLGRPWSEHLEGAE
jgi:hypothetical protein